MEIKSNKQEISYERPIKTESDAKTFRGLLNGYIQKCSNIDNKTVTTKQEMLMIFRELLRKFNKFYPQEVVKNRIEILTGWQGEGATQIYKGFDNDFEIVEYIKDKHSGEVKPQYKTIKKENVNKMLFILKGLEIGKNYKCYYFSKKLGYSEWKELWKERHEYFERYYFPIKILEAMNLINYSGKGTIRRVK